MNTHEKFLSFNGKNIIFLNKDGQYWIAVKPICEALGVDYVRQFKNLKDNIILAPALSKQTMQIPSENGVFILLYQLFDRFLKMCKDIDKREFYRFVERFTTQIINQN